MYVVPKRQKEEDSCMKLNFSSQVINKIGVVPNLKDNPGVAVLAVARLSLALFSVHACKAFT